MAAEAPYRLPANLDLSRLRSIIFSKRAAAEDHISALREDPGYFADCIGNFKDHRGELVLDKHGKVHPRMTANSYQKGLFWGSVMSQLIWQAYVLLETWDDMCDHLSLLESLQAKYADVISPGEDLPEDFRDAWLRFYCSVDHANLAPIEVLRTYCASPPARHLFLREPDLPGSGIQNTPIVQKTGTADPIRIRFDLNLASLLDDRERHVAGVELLVDGIEHLLQTEPRIREMLSPHLKSAFADLSIVRECSRQMDSYLPWAASFDHTLYFKGSKIMESYDQRTEYFWHYQAVTQGISIPQIERYQNGRSCYPVDKRQTRDVTETMRQAEGYLDWLWHKVDQHMFGNKSFDIEGTALARLLSHPRILRRTPEWVESGADLPEQANGTTTTRELYKPLSEIYFDLQQRTERTLVTTPQIFQKIKEKTRGTKSPQDITSNEVSNDAPLPKKEQPSILLDKRALKVFSTLFHQPSLPATPGEIAWADFLYAMTFAGFVAEKVYGSVWYFRPCTTLNIDQSIQFHEPHPSDKIPYWNARRIGRRLSRAYGWHGGVFSKA